MDIKTKKRFVSASLLVFVFFIFTGNVFAIEYGGFGGRPAFPRMGNPRTESIFVHTLKLGDIQEEGVLAINNSTERKTMLIYAVDSTSSTGGVFACEQLSQKKDGVSTWIALDKSEVTLDPETNEIIPFTITVPQNASVGEHNGCIVLQEKKSELDDQGGASLSFRTGLRVAITVPGELDRKLKIVDFTVTSQEDGDFLLQPKIRNFGNVSIDADIQVITRYFCGLIHTKHGGQYPILRDDTSDWNFDLKKPFWGGWYRSNFVVEYDGNSEAGVGVKSGKAMTRLNGPSIWFFSPPTSIALVIEIIVFLLIIFGGFLFWVSQKRKKWIEKSWVLYKIKSEENIKSLAERFNVSWELIARANKLRPPYTLEEGDELKVPPHK